MKKIIGLLLALAIVCSCFSMIPFSASADIIDGDGGTSEADDDFNDTIAQDVIDLINGLGEITSLNQKAAVVAARAAYTALTSAQQVFVTNYSVLQAAEAKIADLEAAAAVDQKITDLGTITSLNQKAAVVAARTAYTALTSAQKDLVTKLAVLTAAEAKIADLEAAQVVIDLIAALGPITSPDQKAAIVAARTAYTALTPAQKDLVPLPVLVAAEAKIADLEAAQNVIDLIAALGPITSLDQEAAVVAARTAYTGLTADQKTLVTNLDVLVAAEAAIEGLRVKLGDVDGDGKVNVSDVVKLRAVIMKGSSTADELRAGDMDKNKSLDVSDVVALRSYIMKG